MLIVDDDETVRRLVARILNGCDVRSAADGVEGLECVRRESFDLVILDLAMPRMGGLELLQLARQENPKLYVAVFTGNGDPETLRRAEQLGARVCLTKPFTLDQLADVVARTKEG